MKIVNRSNIPDALFRYLNRDDYDYEVKGNSFSVTELLNPVQMILLKRRYWSQLETDAIDRLWILLGTGVHAILEKEPGIEKIERLKFEVLGRTVSGRFDRIFNNEITDYKVTSAFTITYGSRNEEWTMQLSLYRWLYFKQKGILLGDTGYIVALLRDWSEKNTLPLKSGKENRYPKAPAVQLSFRLKSIEETEAWVTEKMRAIIQAERLQDIGLPNCTDDERWFQREKGTYMRCQKYCDAKAFCQQIKTENELFAIPDAEEVA